MSKYNAAMPPSPVEIARLAGPTGNGKWDGFDSVYSNISKGCEKMGKDKHFHLSTEHVESMADLGSGHEERMKSRLWWMRDNHWI